MNVPEANASIEGIEFSESEEPSMLMHRLVKHGFGRDTYRGSTHIFSSRENVSKSDWHAQLVCGR